MSKRTKATVDRSVANPQREDGHVDIANEVVESLAKIHLSGYESRVLWAIFRKTYGWHKKEDWITNTQIAKMTDIAESHISRTIKILIDRKIVTKNGKKLSFQKDYEKWGNLPKLVTPEKLPIQDKELPKMVSEVTKNGKKNIPKLVYTKETKETTTKETIQKKGDIFIKTWKDFKDMRRKKNKPMTGRAEELIINELNKLTNDEKTQIAILNQSIMNSWQGVFPLKERFNNKDGDDESQPKYIPKTKLTPEQIEKNKVKITEALEKLKNKFDIPIKAKGG